MSYLLARPSPQGGQFKPSQSSDAPEPLVGFELWLAENPLLAQLIGLGGLVVVALLAWGLTYALLLPLLGRLIKRSSFTWDDAFLDARFFRWLVSLFPTFVTFAGVVVVRDHFYLGRTAFTVVRNVSAAAMMLFAVLAACGLLNALQSIYASRAGSARRPIKGYVELAKIFLVVVGILVTIALLLGRDVGGLLTGVGAMTAVLMLIFKDTILSAVASVQLANQNMLRIGDWIEMPSVGADGDVVDIALHTVKVQNFDKTISTIPTYRLVSDTFRNWRGMSESGGRRVKRSVTIDISTIRFLTGEEIERFGQFALLGSYILDKKRRLQKANADTKNQDIGVNRLRLTNVGTFRAYMVRYLRSLPKVHSGMTFLVRQLPPSENGLPIEMYLFTNTTAWVEYEEIQADIFDHLLAALPEFGLRAFQRPTGADLSALRLSAGGQSEARG